MKRTLFFVLTLATLALAINIPRATAQGNPSGPDRAVMEPFAARDRVAEAPVFPVQAVKPKRPAALPALYAGFAAIQGADLWQMYRVSDRGLTELNPVMRTSMRNPAVGLTVKAAATASTICFVERLWKGHHRTAAIVTMVALNGAMAAVVAHNAGRLQTR